MGRDVTPEEIHARNVSSSPPIPQVYLHFPYALAAIEDACGMSCMGETVIRALDHAVAHNAKLKPYMYRHDGSLGVSVLVNGLTTDRRKGLETRLQHGDTIALLPRFRTDP